VTYDLDCAEAHTRLNGRGKDVSHTTYVKGNFTLYIVSRECSHLPMRWYSLLRIVIIHYH